MSSQKWEIGPVKLVNGWDAYVDFVQQGEFCIRYLGRYKLPGGQWYALHWEESGQVPNSCEGYGHNLAPPPKKTLRVRLWANVYEDGSMFSYPTKKQADDSAQYGRFALIEIDREVEEGEGLDPNVRSDAANMRRAK